MLPDHTDSVRVDLYDALEKRISLAHKKYWEKLFGQNNGPGLIESMLN